MKSHKILASALALLIFFAAGSANAQWTVGFNAGSAEVEGGDSNLEFRADARGGYSFHPRFGIEAEVIGARSVLDEDLDAVLLNAVFELSKSEVFSPYVLVGVGAARVRNGDFYDHYDPHGDRFDSEDGSAFQAALGARYYFGESRTMGLRVELSRLVENTEVFDSDQHTSLTAGMTWRFGG